MQPLIRVWLTGPLKVTDATGSRIEGTFVAVPGSTPTRLSFHPDREAPGHERSTIDAQRELDRAAFVWFWHEDAWKEGRIESVVDALTRERDEALANRDHWRSVADAWHVKIADADEARDKLALALAAQTLTTEHAVGERDRLARDLLELHALIQGDRRFSARKPDGAERTWPEALAHVLAEADRESKLAVELFKVATEETAHDRAGVIARAEVARG